jgi:hypothetical protein
MKIYIVVRMRDTVLTIFSFTQIHGTNIAGKFHWLRKLTSMSLTAGRVRKK